MTQLMVGVLVSIPEHMRLIYEEAAIEQQKELTEIIADDCNTVCQQYFEEVEQTRIMMEGDHND